MRYPFAVLDDAGKASMLPLLDCNARCPFCSTRVYSDQGVHSPGDFQRNELRPIKQYTQTFEEVQRGYDEMRARGIDRFTLQGGEPTLWEPLAAILAYGWQVGAKQQVIVSNGIRFRDAAYAERIVAAAPSTIVLSIFGACAATHDESVGVPGAFDDVEAGFANLLAAAKRHGGRTSLMVQITLHARNHRELPETVRHWHEKGAQDFSVRLLRETLNITRGQDRWLFDLAELREPLERTLDYVRARSDIHLRFSEVPYCLLSRSYLGFVLRDLGGNRNLFAPHRDVTRHFDAEVRRPDKPLAPECAGCDLRGGCVTLEDAHRPRFTGRLASVLVAPRVQELAGCTGSEALHLRPFFDLGQRLESFGVPAELGDALANAYRAALQTIAPREAADEVLPAPDRAALRSLAARHPGARLEVGVVTLADLDARGPLSGDRRETLERLQRSAPPAWVRTLAYLERQAECVLRVREMMVFADRREPPASGALRVVLVVDDHVLDAQTAVAMVRTLLADPVAGSSPEAAV